MDEIRFLEKWRDDYYGIFRAKTHQAFVKYFNTGEEREWVLGPDKLWNVQMELRKNIG